MLKQKKKARVTIPPVVAAVVRPVNKRLARMEDLLFEIRREQDVRLRKINKLREQLDELAEILQQRRGRR
jgi:hypothetical protein